MTKSNPLFHPLLIALAAATLLPWLMGLAGLTTTSATEVVIFALACMGLNLLAGNAVQVIVAAQRMLPMPGTDFLTRVRLLHPDLSLIHISEPTRPY